jgi:hypothetical protein
MTDMEKDKIIKDCMEKAMYNGCGVPTCLSVVLFIVVVFFSSCATRTKIEYKDRDVNHYITNTVHDTVRIHDKDSVAHTIRIVGDTVYDTKYVEKTRWRDRIVEKHDTCWRDSVVTEYKETTKEIIKIPKIFWGSFVFSIIIIIFALVKLTRWLRLI